MQPGKVWSTKTHGHGQRPLAAGELQGGRRQARACMSRPPTVLPPPWIMSASAAGMPHACSMRRNSSATSDTLRRGPGAGEQPALGLAVRRSATDRGHIMS